MDEKVTIPTTRPPETPLPSREEPLLELRWKKWCYYFAILVIICCTWFCIVGVIIPYLKTGDVNEIWPAHKDLASRKATFLFIAPVWLLLSPFLTGAFRVGVISFYETYVEQRPYLPFFKKITIPYDALYVKERSNGMRLTNGIVPPWLGNQFKYWKMSCWEAIGISVINMCYSNPECHPKAIQLARERAVKCDRS